MAPGLDPLPAELAALGAVVTECSAATVTAGGCDFAVVPVPEGSDAEDTVARTLALVQDWLASDAVADARLVLVTRGAVPAGPGEDADVAQAAVWGLVRTAQAENPGRFTLIDIDGSEGGARALAAALAAEEPQLAVRDGRALVARLRRAVRRELPVPEAPAWRLETGGDGTLDGLALVPHEEALRPLAEGEIRVGIRAAGPELPRCRRRPRSGAGADGTGR
ncbi:SpnB-like Rossmann fold domain-containing protein [Streptomyces thermocoprophilus]|uniref:SpnB-like Rossmann fold domain-containing protein n=1 Tax=Streptomyces thermocoprophilus TaxID=78356 RepID=UPI003AA7BDC4